MIQIKFSKNNLIETVGKIFSENVATFALSHTNFESKKKRNEESHNVTRSCNLQKLN